ncbi:hypothetical protein D3C72_919300 [compost metagenome]
MAVQRFDPLDGRGHGFGVGQTAREGAVQDLPAQVALDSPRRARADDRGALGQDAARQQGTDRQQGAGDGVTDSLRQGADRQGQAGGESDRRDRVGDDQTAGQRHQASPGRQRRLQPLGRCGGCIDRLGRHCLSCSMRATRHIRARRGQWANRPCDETALGETPSRASRPIGALIRIKARQTALL